MQLYVLTICCVWRRMTAPEPSCTRKTTKLAVTRAVGKGGGGGARKSLLHTDKMECSRLPFNRRHLPPNRRQLPANGAPSIIPSPKRKKSGSLQPWLSAIVGPPYAPCTTATAQYKPLGGPHGVGELCVSDDTGGIPRGIHDGVPLCFHNSTCRPPIPRCVTFLRVAVSLRGPRQSPVLPFTCCVDSMLSDGRCGRRSLWRHFRASGVQ